MRNQSLTQLVKSCATPLIVSIGLFAMFSASAADPVFKWKDAQGHSHYSQSPPQGIKYETIAASGAPVDGSITSTESAQSANSAAQPEHGAANAESTPAQKQRTKLCETARANAVTLKSNATVIGDVNGDGKAVTLNVQQHDAALSDANKEVALYCTN